MDICIFLSRLTPSFDSLYVLCSCLRRGLFSTFTYSGTLNSSGKTILKEKERTKEMARKYLLQHIKKYEGEIKIEEDDTSKCNVLDSNVSLEEKGGVKEKREGEKKLVKGNKKSITAQERNKLRNSEKAALYASLVAELQKEEKVKIGK
jgi:hypothetical protein